jgi:hypothetical protein
VTEGAGVGEAEERAEQWRLRCQQVGTDNAAAASRIVELEDELARERAARESIEHSHSWQLTAPLRRLRRRLPRVMDTDQTAALFERRMRAAYEARARSWLQPEPATFNEKIWHRRLADRRPVLRTYCDKHASLVHAGTLLPAELLPSRIVVLDSPEELEDVDLPREYVVKASHGSGGTVVVWDGPSSQGQDWVYPWIRKAYSAPDDPKDRVAADLQQCMAHDYGWDMLEWGYTDLPRHLVVDLFYRGPDGGVPVDLRCYVFHGRVECIEVVSDRQQEATRYASWHDRAWNVLPIRTRLQHRAYPRPTELDLVIEVAETLAADEAFVRVDLLLTAEGPKFGEITPYSHAGNVGFRQQWADEYLGRFW